MASPLVVARLLMEEASTLSVDERCTALRRLYNVQRGIRKDKTLLLVEQKFARFVVDRLHVEENKKTLVLLLRLFSLFGPLYDTEEGCTDGEYGAVLDAGVIEALVVVLSREDLEIDLRVRATRYLQTITDWMINLSPLGRSEKFTIVLWYGMRYVAGKIDGLQTEGCDHIHYSEFKHMFELMIACVSYEEVLVSSLMEWIVDDPDLLPFLFDQANAPSTLGWLSCRLLIKLLQHAPLGQERSTIFIRFSMRIPRVVAMLIAKVRALRWRMDELRSLEMALRKHDFATIAIMDIHVLGALWEAVNGMRPLLGGRWSYEDFQLRVSQEALVRLALAFLSYPEREGVVNAEDVMDEIVGCGVLVALARTLKRRIYVRGGFDLAAGVFRRILRAHPQTVVPFRDSVKGGKTAFSRLASEFPRPITRPAAEYLLLDHNYA